MALVAKKVWGKRDVQSGGQLESKTEKPEHSWKGRYWDQEQTCLEALQEVTGGKELWEKRASPFNPAFILIDRAETQSF